MKNYNKVIVMMLSMSTIFAGACKKLDVFPANANVDGNLITDEQSARILLNGVYYRFANASIDYSGNPKTGWTDVNEFMPSELAGTLTSYSGGLHDDSVNSYAFSSSYFRIDTIWRYGYNLVNAANGFLKNATPATGIPASVKLQLLSEARFLRAFGNAGLLFSFGQYRDPSSQYGIIVRDDFVMAANFNLPRTGVAAAYNAIFSDLDIAIQGLPTLNTAIYYANVWDARLLKARVLMNRGAAGDYAEVIALTNDIITNGPFVLEDSVKDIFQTKGFTSREVMLGIQPYPEETNKWSNSLRYVSDSLASLLSGDARDAWVYKPEEDFTGVIDRRVTKFYSADADEPVPTPLSTNCYVFRLTEAYLLKAEAIALSGGDLATSRGLLKTVLLHAGAAASSLNAADNASTPEALQWEIVREYLRNFVYENGVDWLALRRMSFATIQRFNPRIKDVSRLILPIPMPELLYNSKVIQNPGY